MSRRLRGAGISPGLAIGRAVVMTQAPRPGMNDDSAGRGAAAECSSAPGDVAHEIERFERGVRRASAQLEEVRIDAERRLGSNEAAIFAAQLLMAQDPSLAESVVERIRSGLVTAECACIEASEEHAAMLAAIGDPYLAARASDIREVGNCIVRCMRGDSRAGADEAGADTCEMPTGSIIIAEDLPAADAALLNPAQVRGVVLRHGSGATSHTAILLRAMGIPAVASVAAAAEAGYDAGTDQLRDGDAVVVDGDAGEVFMCLDEQELAAFARRAAALDEERLRLAELRDVPAITLDSRRVEVFANIGNPDDIRLALDSGAEGVGLFRTEFLFIDRPMMPDENEQFEAYRSVLAAMAPRPVIIRTLDVGGDKHISYLNTANEDNPFLGLRAIRLCLRETDVFKTQLRAMLRASIHGNLRIMFPMVATRAELLMARAALCDVAQQLAADGITVSPHIPVGIMVETPAAAVCADVLARECDFFSLGTNDLVQYTMACDRGNPAVGYLSDPFSPAVLRLVAQVIEAGHAQGIPVAICGEMAAMPLAIPLLIGMGIDELSMASSSVPRAKQIVRSVNSRSAADIWSRVRKLSDAEQVRAYLESVR